MSYKTIGDMVQTSSFKEGDTFIGIRVYRETIPGVPSAQIPFKYFLKWISNQVIFPSDTAIRQMKELINIAKAEKEDLPVLLESLEYEQGKRYLEERLQNG